MNQDTGEIYDLAPGQPKRDPKDIELSFREAEYLKGRAEKERLVVLKRVRRAAVRAAKRATGARLTSEEMTKLKAVVADFVATELS